MDKANTIMKTRRLTLVVLIAWVVPFGRSISADQQQAASLQTAAAKPGDAQQQSETPETLHLMVGRSLVITSPARVRRISIADPNIADTLIVSPTQIVVNGKAPGATSLVIWDESGQSQTFDLFVDLDVLSVSQEIRQAFPDEQVKIEAAKDVVVLSGRVSSQAVADKILDMAKAVSPKAISLLEVPTAPSSGQILVQVKFAEIDRSAVSQLGVNIFKMLPGTGNTLGSITTQQFSPPSLTQNGLTETKNSLGVNVATQWAFSNLLNIFLFRPDISLGTTIALLQQNNLIQILAEPNVLTQTGKEASFLAGGEFPFPVVQTGTGGVPVVTIQFREFGVRLTFTPTLTADGKIHLKVRPEVSSLDFTQALTISGFLIPALSTRRVESEMDLKDGQTFAIAGLLDNRVTENFSKVPGLGDVPLFGKLFQSRNLNKSKDELLVLVTPRVVDTAAASHEPAMLPFPKTFLPPTIAAPHVEPAPSGRK
jgi:pilus assembly protein CpaC